MKIFDLFETEGVKAEDPGLRRYINLTAIIKARGREREKFGKAKVNIVERLINLLSVAGHRGKKHKLMTFTTGKWTKQAKVVLAAFRALQKQTNQNPLQIFIKALEQAAPRDEITVIEYGGARYPQAVDSSPLRRLNLALRHIVHSTYDRSFNKRIDLAKALADVISLTAQGSSESAAITKRNEIEKQADSAR